MVVHRTRPPNHSCIERTCHPFPPDFWEQGKIFLSRQRLMIIAGGKKWNADVAKVLGAYADELEGALLQYR